MKLPIQKNRARAGFTLTEAIVASVVLAMVFTALLSAISVARRSVSLAENHRAAVHLARGAIEDLRRFGYTAPELAVGTRPLPDGRGSYKVVADANGWDKDITVNIDWVEPNGKIHTVSLTTTISRSLHK